MGELIDLAKRRRAQAHWGGMIILRQDETNVTAEMVDFWGDDLREPPERLRVWATAIEDLARQMRETADSLSEQSA